MRIKFQTNKENDKCFLGFFLSCFSSDGSSGSLTILFYKWVLEFDAKWNPQYGKKYYSNRNWYYVDRFIPNPFSLGPVGIYFSFRLRHEFRKIRLDDDKKIRMFAEYAHKDQKYGEHPYSYHLEHVNSTLHWFGVKDTSILCASWLHDVLEDTKIGYPKIEKVFSKEVADIVFSVTNEKGSNRKERGIKTYPKIKSSLKGTILKLADRIANTVESMATNKGLLDMYRKEYPSFKSGIYNEEFLDNEIVSKMWKHLDKLMRVN